MKPSNELFKLIKSMSKSEKRFFKLSSSLQSGNKNYLKIFDYIENQDDYDEDALKKDFAKETFIKHLPSEKNHLYKLILKSLRSFYSENTVSSILKQELKNVEILYNKALYKECAKFVVRAKEIAKSFEKFYYWFELLTWEKKLVEEFYQTGEENMDIESLINEETIVIDKLRNLAEYQVIYSKINLIFRSGGFTRTKKEREVVESIADFHLIKGKNTALSIRAASICYYIKGLCAATNRNYDDSFQFFNRTKEILDKNPKIKLDNTQRYISTLSFLLRCYIDNKDFKQAELLINEIRELEGTEGFNSTDLTVKIFGIVSYLELLMLNVKGDFHKAVNLIPDIEVLENNYIGKVSKEQTVLLLYTKAISYFGIGDFKKTLFYVNQILNDNEQNLRQDIYSFSRLVNIVTHFELENYDFLEYVIKSTNRYFNQLDQDLEVEQICIKYFRKLSKTMNLVEKLTIYQNMKIELTESLKDPNEQVVLEYFNILAWLESKLQKISFSDAIKLTLNTNSKSVSETE